MGKNKNEKSKKNGEPGEEQPDQSEQGDSGKIRNKAYQAELRRLHVELVTLQN